MSNEQKGATRKRGQLFNPGPMSCVTIFTATLKCYDLFNCVPNEQKGATRNRGQLTNPGPMGMAAELADVLPLLAKLSWKGLQGKRDNPQLIFNTEDLHEAGILMKQREY